MMLANARRIPIHQLLEILSRIHKLRALVLLLAMWPAGAVAAGAPPLVDAGPDKSLAFPAKDLTLFGHATDPENDPLVVTWTRTSGPASVVFSAPWALATTVTFTTAGTYVFQLAVSDGTSVVISDVTVTMNPLSSQTAFYVDPTAAASPGNGTAASPWKSFVDNNPNQAAQWTAINAALASNDVIIFFSARRAGSDTAEEIVGTVNVKRTDRSTHRLTLDGMSKYNINDASPSWTDYSGSSRMRIRGNRTNGNPVYFSLGWYDGDPAFSQWNGGQGSKLDYVTMRGFEVTGISGRVTWGGSYNVLEYIWSHDVTDEGAAVQLAAAVTDTPACVDMGRSHDITIRNIVVERVIGEGLYVAGTYLLEKYGGCPSYGNTHSDILIEGNTIRNAGQNGDEGDGIDLKGGLMNVTVRNNIVQNPFAPGSGGHGMVAEGVFTGRTNYLIEGNRFSGGTGSGMMLNGQNGTVVRNNVIFGMEGAGIRSATMGTFGCSNLEVYNNTIYDNTGGGISINYTNGIKLNNNLVFGNGSGGSSANSSNIISDYNLWAPGKATWPEGAHSVIQASTSGITANAAGGDFQLVVGSPAVDRGLNLALTGFTVALENTTRPQGASWDIGAYELLGTPAPSAPTNIRIVP
jgi:parallel beta-helix repeat protein